MIDVVSALKTYIDTEWTETDPAKANLKWALSYSEFDRIKTFPQIAINEIREVRPIQTFVVDGVYRVEHNVMLSVLLRPTKYDDTTVDAAETTFKNMKAEINRILNAGRYNVNEVSKVDLSSWETVTDRDAEPVVFEARQVLKCTYFITETDFSQTKFPFIWLT